MSDFEKMLRDMFSSIWDCEIDHPLWQDTVGEIMTAVIQAHGKCMPELTDEQVIDYCKKKGYKIVADDLFDLLSKPEPHEGHWIKHIDPSDGEQYECSRCGVLWEFTDGSPEDNEAYFCPKCGAKMKGAEHETN